MKKVKWGVIGAGGIADRRTIPGMLLAENAELVAVMEINMELAEKIRAKHNAKKAYDNIDALLADEEIEAVYIASPVVYHKEQAFKAAAAKKHILLEKPLALTSQDSQEIIDKCKAEGVLLAHRLYDALPRLSPEDEGNDCQRRSGADCLLPRTAHLLVS